MVGGTYAPRPGWRRPTYLDPVVLTLNPKVFPQHPKPFFRAFAGKAKAPVQANPDTRTPFLPSQNIKEQTSQGLLGPPSLRPPRPSQGLPGPCSERLPGQRVLSEPSDFQALAMPPRHFTASQELMGPLAWASKNPSARLGASRK